MGSTNRFELKRLNPRHFQMVDLLVAGYTQRETAEIIGCSHHTVKIVARSPLFIAEFNRRMKVRNAGGVAEEKEAFESKARSILQQNSTRAAETQVELLDSDDDSIKLRASGSILDRVLGKPNDNVSGGISDGVGIQISEKTAELLITALKESRNGQQRHSADGPSAEASQDEQGDVRETSLLGSGLGHRKAQALCSGQVIRDFLPEGKTSETVPEEGPQPVKGSSNGEHESDQEQDC